MTRTVQAVYENGAFRPLEPVSCQEIVARIRSLTARHPETQPYVEQQVAEENTQVEPVPEHGLVFLLIEKAIAAIYQ